MSDLTIMKAKPFTDKLLAKMKPPYLIQRKINGDSGIIYQRNGHIQIRSSGNHIFETVPHINEEFLNLGLPDGKYDGELYCHGLKLQDIQSIVAVGRKSLHPDYKRITYQLYDIDIENLKQIDRIEYINTLLHALPAGGIVQRVPTYAVDDKMDIPKLVEIFMEEGYEGAIIRDAAGYWEAKRSSSILKIKPKEKDEYRIIGYLEEMTIHGEPKNALGSFICMKDGETFKVGTGPALTRSKRILYWREKEKLPGKTLIVKYQELTKRGVPYSCVALEVK